MTSIEALAAELRALRELTETKLNHLQDAIERLAREMVSAAEFQNLKQRVDAVEREVERQDQRLERVERVVWLQVGLFTLFGVPAILMLLAQLIGHLF